MGRGVGVVCPRGLASCFVLDIHSHLLLIFQLGVPRCTVIFFCQRCVLSSARLSFRSSCSGSASHHRSVWICFSAPLCGVVSHILALFRCFFNHFVKHLDHFLRVRCLFMCTLLFSLWGNMDLLDCPGKLSFSAYTHLVVGGKGCSFAFRPFRFYLFVIPFVFAYSV